MKCERSEGVGEAQNETGERERKRVGGKGQALPWKLGAISWLHVFPLVPHPPPTPFHYPPGPLVFPLLRPRLSSLLSFRSLYHDHTPFTFLSLSLCLSHPSSPSSISRSLHQPHPCFSSPPHPFIPHWLHFYPLALFFPPFFFSIFLSPPLFLFSQLLRLNPQLCAKSSKEETERLKSNIKKKETEKENKTPSGCPRALISEEGRWKGRKRGQKGRNTFYEDRVISLRARM